MLEEHDCLKGGLPLAQELKSSPTLFWMKHVAAAGSLIMQLRESLACACSVVFKQNQFSSAQFLVKTRKQMNTLHIYGFKNILK